MLTIHMPGGHQDKHKRRRRQALGYAAAGVLIITSIIVTWNTQVWWLPLLLEAWWLWAVIGLDWEA